MAGRLSRRGWPSFGSYPGPGRPGRRRCAVRRPLHPGLALRSQPGQPPHRHLPAHPQVGFQRHAPGGKVHQLGPGIPGRRLRPPALRLHRHHRRPADHHRRRPAATHLRGPPAGLPGGPTPTRGPRWVVPVAGKAGARHLRPWPVPPRLGRPSSAIRPRGHLGTVALCQRRDRNGLRGWRGPRHPRRPSRTVVRACLDPPTPSAVRGPGPLSRPLQPG